MSDWKTHGRFDRWGRPKWKGHLLSYYCEYKDPGVFGWHPENGYKYSDPDWKERSAERYIALNALANREK